MEKVRNANLELLRIIACVGVVGLHTLYKSDGSILYYLCGFSIPIFFMVSGALLINKKELGIVYSLKKILTILALMLCWNIIYSCVYLIINQQFINPIELMIRNFWQKDFFGHFWFLYSIIIIYMVLPFIKQIFQKLSRGVFLTVIVIILMISIDFGNVLIQYNITQSLRIWTWFGYFLLGGVLGNEKIKRKIYKVIEIRLGMISLIMFSIIIIWVQYFLGFKKLHIYLAEYHYDNIFTILWVSSIFILINLINMEMNLVIKTISKCTMGIYIIHPVVISIFIKKNDYPIFLWLGLTLVTFLFALIIINIQYINKLIKI